MKNMGVILTFLLFSGIADSQPVKEEASKTDWVLTTNNFKNVKANGQPLKKANVWQFSTLHQLETTASEAYVFLPDRFYLKLFPETMVKWNGELFQLIKGRVYIKNLANDFTFQILGLFKFSIKIGDFVVEHSAATKITDFEFVHQSQNIQIDSDDRTILASEGTKHRFIPEFVDGDMAYDFLLNDRKIPKMKMEKTELKNVVILDVAIWKQTIKKAAEIKKKAVAKAKADSGIYICKAPKGALNNCVFVKESTHCARYTCDLNGAWALRTEFEKNEFCPKIKTIKPCEWLGR